MNEHDLQELYGRLDERLKNIESQLADLNRARRCETNGEKIRTLEKLVWGALGTAAAAAAKAFWPVVK